VPLTALKGTMTAGTSTSFADRLGQVQAPTIVVGGTHDPIFSPQALQDGVAAPLAGARVALLDCGHEIPLEQPRELAAIIEAFLAALG
jgi:pimeloyl-ACP methyl ester carboxylesterase